MYFDVCLEWFQRAISPRQRLAGGEASTTRIAAIFTRRAHASGTPALRRPSIRRSPIGLSNWPPRRKPPIEAPGSSILPVDLDLGAGPFSKQHPRSPALGSTGTSLPLSSRAAGPTATTSPSSGFSLAVSGIMMPPRLLLSFNAAYDDAVVQWTEFHGLRSQFDLRCRPRGSLGATCPDGRLGSSKRRVNSHCRHSIQESAKLTEHEPNEGCRLIQRCSAWARRETTSDSHF